MSASSSLPTFCKSCHEGIRPGTQYCNYCSTIIVYAGFTTAQLREAFDLVANVSNWKLPIDAYLPGDASEELIAQVKAGVIFFAGCPALIVPVLKCGKRVFQVRAAGYYMAVGS